VRICTETGNAFNPREAAWLVKCSIEGFAMGCMQAWPRWNLPPLFESGVRFQLPPEHGTGIEYMRLPPFTYRDKVGDCDRLLIWWLCEQWAQGKPASCTAVFLGGAIHVQGRQSFDDSGPIVDPAVILGAPTR
jgi:hypothetical protein